MTLQWKNNRGFDVNGLDSRFLEKGDRFVYAEDGYTVGATVVQATKYKENIPYFEALERDIVVATDEGDLRRYYAGEFICDAYPIGTI